MKIKGMGYAILRITRGQIPELWKIPTEIKFVKTLEACGRHWERYDPNWYHDEHPFYFQIEHRFLPRTPDRGPLMIFTFNELIKQYEDCEKMEKEKKGQPVTEELKYQGWEDD